MNVFAFRIISFVAFWGVCAGELSCSTHATMLRQLEREGFHVEILSLVEMVVEVEDAKRWENCTLVLREQIPDSFYANPDQLSELSRSGVLHACTLDKVDIESPRYLSDRHVVYVYGRFKKSHNLIYSNLKLPVHLRYQRPKYGGGYSAAELKAPTLLVRCDKMSTECQHLMKSKAPCFDCSPEMCDWMRISYKTNSPNFTLPVPVGNLDHLYFVSAVTYLLTYGGCLYVILALLANNSKQKQK